MTYLDLELGRFLDSVAARQPAPGGGSAAAVTVSLAGGLVSMVARFSDAEIATSQQLASEADRWRGRAGNLADADADAYAAVLDAYGSARRGSGENQVRAALQRAAEVPLEVAELGAEVVRLAAVLAVKGNPNLRGDAITAALIAEAAVRSAAHLVRLNVEAGGEGEDGELVRRAQDCVDAARAAVRDVDG